jgi:hypothetical protein
VNKNIAFYVKPFNSHQKPLILNKLTPKQLNLLHTQNCPIKPLAMDYGPYAILMDKILSKDVFETVFLASFKEMWL